MIRSDADTIIEGMTNKSRRSAHGEQGAKRCRLTMRRSPDRGDRRRSARWLAQARRDADPINSQVLKAASHSSIMTRSPAE